MPSRPFTIPNCLLVVFILGLALAPLIAAADEPSAADPPSAITMVRPLNPEEPKQPLETKGDAAPASPASPTSPTSPQADQSADTPQTLPAELPEPGQTPSALDPQAAAAADALPSAGTAEATSPAPPSVEQGLTKASPEEPAGKLKPIPDPAPSGEVKIETASFKAVTPGKSTLAEVQEAWGSPTQMAVQDNRPVHLYRVEPFDRIEVAFADNTVASIIIRLQQAVPAGPLAEQLKLADIRPVLVSNELGEILGQSYPERGVLFAFEPAGQPGKATMRVVDVILEPVTAEAFVLRAETYLDTELTASAEDLKHAIQLQPQLARAHWLQARVAANLGNIEMALSSSAEAIRLEPANPQFLVTRAQLLRQAGRISEAVPDVQAAIKNSDNRPHIKARAFSLLGDLVNSEPKPDHAKALENHMQAISIADPLISSPHPAIRTAAMEVMIDAHLGASQDIAWGSWENKKLAVSTWLQRASEYAEAMTAIETGSHTDALRFRVATRALAACVGAQGELSPADWTRRAIEVGERMIEANQDPHRKQQIAWDLGLALYDSVQVHQIRGEQDAALEVGRRAAELLERGSEGSQRPANWLLMGRLYFRLGTIYAVNKSDHHEAVRWFDKSIPLFKKAADGIPAHEVGRLGETLVSMGVSYWEVGNREVALNQTKTGVELIEAAVEAGYIEKLALEVPYSNLATMHRQLGENAQADRFLKMASEHRDTLR
ncbi:MAG: hypothetical protein ACOX1P_33100 [Thermoguttaceae bacterium]|jgi:tetratricopeptide (TPR) repeat protein